VIECCLEWLLLIADDTLLCDIPLSFMTFPFAPLKETIFESVDDDGPVTSPELEELPTISN
jgi:hypothetical protein